MYIHNSPLALPFVAASSAAFPLIVVWNKYAFRAMESCLYNPKPKPVFIMSPGTNVITTV